jgi:hypothetical protein
MRPIYAIPALTLLVATCLNSAFAGAISGGGGKSVVCRDANHKIQTAELLDLFEGRIMYGRKIVYSADGVEKQLATAFGKTVLNHQMQYDQTALDIQAHLRMLPPSISLLPVDDAVEVIVPVGCALEQLVNYVNHDAILVSQEIWDQLNETNRAAALAHEAFYKNERENYGATDSRRSRNVISELFSDHGAFEDPQAGVPQDAYSCQGSTDLQNGESDDFYFYLYPYQGGLRLQFTRLANEDKLTKTTADIGLPSFPFAGNYPSNISSISAGAYTQGEFEEGDWVGIIESADSNIVYGTSGWIPGLVFPQTEFHCFRK